MCCLSKRLNTILPSYTEHSRNFTYPNRSYNFANDRAMQIRIIKNSPFYDCFGQMRIINKCLPRYVRSPNRTDTYIFTIRIFSCMHLHEYVSCFMCMFFFIRHFMDDVGDKIMPSKHDRAILFGSTNNTING